MLDLDLFKSVNDDFGHEQDDRVIALLARCAQAHLPTNTVLARLGGEAFFALLPDANAADRYQVPNRCAKRFIIKQQCSIMRGNIR